MWISSTAFWPAQCNALSSLPRESLLCPLADEISFNLCGETESEGEDLALDVLSQPVVVLDGPDAAPFSHADIQDFHDHEKIPAEAGNLTADDYVVLADPAEKPAELPLGVTFGAADGFLNPVIDFQILPPAEIVNLKTLVLNRLSVAADANVTVDHNSLVYYFTENTNL